MSGGDTHAGSRARRSCCRTGRGGSSASMSGAAVWRSDRILRGGRTAHGPGIY